MTPDLTRFVALVVLDGWGVAAPGPGNAISSAQTVNFNKFWASSPHTQLLAAGESVGLPRGQPGNTETGHLNLGAGRIVYQDLARINMAIADGTFFQNKVIDEAIEHALKNNSNLHFLGLIGEGEVHSNIEHLIALIRLAKEKKFGRVYLHLFTDGRDSPPTSSQIYLEKIKNVCQKEQIGQIASIMGRYWAMDRDRRWDRTARAYFALTKGQAGLVKTPEEVVEKSYSEGKTDEFIDPALIANPAQTGPLAIIKDNDSVIFFNFRIDRPRQLTAAFVVKDFKSNSLALDFDPYMARYEKTHLAGRVAEYRSVFDRGVALSNLYFATMTEYSKSLVSEGIHVIFPPQIIQNPLGKVISDVNFRQLRLAESEKERFVTFYFNGQNENPFPGEERIIVPSPNVSTYDQVPEMSARQVTDAFLETIKNSQGYVFSLINFANPDMVGHTGSIGAVVKACEVVDECVGKIANFILAYGGYLLITGDHGNAEEKIDPKTGQILTEHTTNPVPFIAASKVLFGKPQTLPPGLLADVAPTVLHLLGINVPSDMTGKNLLRGIV